MPSIIDDTIAILDTMGLKADRVTTPPGYQGLQVNLPNDAHAYFVWAKIDDEDFAFRLARFWEGSNPISSLISPTLGDAIAQIRVLASQ